MPAALSIHERQEIIVSHQQGESLASIARRLHRSYDAVRRIYRQYVNSGRLTPAYERCRHTQIRHDGAVYQAAVGMKAMHPGWGAGLILTELRDRYEETQLPSVRTLQRWFRRENVHQRASDHIPKMRIKRGQVPHEVWALDAKEQIGLADGSHVSWLTITDEGSGAILSATLFPHWPMEYRGTTTGERGHTADHASLGDATTDANG